jgi:hypothetical protein
MIWLWLFWIETVAFSGLMVWTVTPRPGGQPLLLSQWCLFVLYLIALGWGAYNFGRFAYRRFKAATAPHK